MAARKGPPPAGDHPHAVIDVLVEIPRGSRNKYEWDPDAGRFRLDRHLFSATVYPADYGFIPGAMGEDGDELDALVLLEEPSFTGCLVRCRPVGLLDMHDEAGRDTKIICVLFDDPRWNHIRDLDDVPEHLRREIRHFFAIYKDLEPGKNSEMGDWGDRAAALEEVRLAFERMADA
jgi:inorganic pyrophosphatase